MMCEWYLTGKKDRTHKCTVNLCIYGKCIIIYQNNAEFELQFNKQFFFYQHKVVTSYFCLTPVRERAVLILTLRLFLIGRDGAHKVLWCHVHLCLSVFVDDLQRGEVAKYLVWGGISSDPVLILHHLNNTQTHRGVTTQKKLLYQR